jgi:glucuronosyltransferase
MRDQKERPIDRAVYWIEYVIRRKGAPHLRSSSRHLNIFQRNLFDLNLLLTFAFNIVFVYAIVRVIINSRKLTITAEAMKKTKKD